MGDDEEAGKGLEWDGKETGGGDEGNRKAGRPRKIEELDKERRESTGCMEDYFKRKREGSGEEDIEGEEEGCKKGIKRRRGCRMVYGRERRVR